ncbi:uncharacterized protein V6R79_001780 [Siganus canaliculatus]
MGKKGKKEIEAPRPETFEPVPVESRSPATVVLLLRSPEEDILVKACEAVYTFAEKGDEKKVSLLGLGALEPLCQLIAHNNKLIRRNAVMALGSMASNGDVKSALKKIDIIIPSVIDKLSPDEDVVVHEFATLTLASLCMDFVCKVHIFENKGLPPLIHLLSSPDPDVQKNSLDIIFNLVQDYQSRLAVNKLGGIPPLLQLLKSDFPVIQHLALKTLENVTTDKDTRSTFRVEQGFEQLMDILSNGNLSDLHVEALQVIANCLSDSENFQMILKDGGLTQLFEFLLAPNKPGIQSNAVKCITRVAGSPENRKLLHDQNMEKVLVELLSVSDISVKTATCQAVSALSLHPASKDSFRDLGCIPIAVQLLSNNSVALKEAAIQALSNLTESNCPNAFAVYEAGGHGILVQLLYGSHYGTVANSAVTLGNLAEQEVIRCSILSHGAIRALVEPLKSTSRQVLLSVTKLLAVLACDAEARTELQSAGGLLPLVNLLQQNDKEVLHNACLVVKICASDETTAVEMCKYGALEMLQEVNQSVAHRSCFTELAMTSLLNSNLSVKYSLTGHLASTDIISDGFYDAGKACVGQRFLTFEELSKQPVNQHRPIIAINATTEKRKEDDEQEDENVSQSSAEEPWKVMDDISLQHLVEKARELIPSLSDEREQYAALARLVSEAMGGAVEMDKLYEFAWTHQLKELKVKLQSNVVPIGLVKRGIYCHRALLFKCLVDSVGMSCTLVRGEYNRAWNEVLLFNGNPSSNGRCQKPSRYVVDLMHQPGNLLKATSPAAMDYKTV